MIIDILKLPTYLITIETAKDRHEQITSICKNIGINNVTYINGKILDKTGLNFMEIQTKKSSLVADAHLQVLKNNKPPFLILEDDINVTESFKPTIDIPDDADCLYLGSSVWGMLNGVSTGGGTRGKKVNQRICKVDNMLGIHAIVYVTQKYVEQTIKNLETCIQKNKFCDECVAEDMINNNVYCVSYPYFYQNDGHNELVTGTPLGLYLK